MLPLKQQFVVENRPGASGNIGATAAAKSAPDGYTFMVTANPALTINPSLYRDLPYDAERDFAPITRGVMAPMVIVASPSLQAKTLAELVALGKSQPGKVAYASAGTGTPLYLGVRMLEETLEIYRELAEKNRETYLPDLALALENLGILANAQHQTEKARQAFEEALKIYKAYAKQNPEQFSSDVKRVEKLLEELQR